MGTKIPSGAAKKYFFLIFQKGQEKPGFPPPVCLCPHSSKADPPPPCSPRDTRPAASSHPGLPLPPSRPPPSLRKAANASEAWNIWLMTGKVLRRQVISTLPSSVGYFNTQCLCKRHNGTCHKLTPSQSSGTSRRGRL